MNLPNILTLSRIGMIVLVVILSIFCGPKIDDVHSISALGISYLTVRIIAVALAFLAALTDLLDGYLARKWNQVTDFGALMDPLADKIFVASCMLLALEYRLMPAWIAIAVLAREFMVTGLRSLAAKKGIVIAADKFGKIKTALQMVMLAIVGSSWIHLIDLWTKETWQWWVWNAYLTGVVIITLYSGASYFIKYRSVFWDNK
jgi:CDP-diacylglycerol--glycerol-3-phosphate 3-phosphatidyltransferase